ncbi:MAG: D-alanyl-D-alanine carboxypeptidase, partial [Acetivibrio sp.]
DHVYKRLYPASITKIMTAYVAFKYADLHDTVTFSYDASHITEWGASLCGFAEGDQVNMQDLLTAFLVCSGNDAGIAIAEHISGSVDEFAKLMNKEAKALGATQSHFVNPHGLHDEKHYTTPYDIYLIFNALIKNENFINIIHTKDIEVTYSSKSGEIKSKTFTSTNRYLCGKEVPPEGVTVIGGKTGTTFKAGSCLVLYSKGSNEHDYISIVFKAENGDRLFYQMTELLKLIPNQ